MNRRLFLAGAGGLAAASAFPFSAHAKSDRKTLSILQGHTSETATQLSVDIKKDVRVSYTLTDMKTGRVLSPTKLTPITHGSSDTRVDKLSFTGLTVNRRYHLIVKNSDTHAVLDDRFLSTVDLQKPGARVALMSCMNDSKGAMNEMWSVAEKAELDYLLFIGDNVYGDFLFLHGPNYLWSRYVETRSNIPFYHWKELKPVIAVWDDHDFGKNNSDGKYKYKNHAYQIFQTFFAQEPDGKSLFRGWGNSTFFQAFDQNFAFFDSRYYRALPNPDGDPAFLGREQIDWMSKAMRNRPRPTWVLQGSPMFGRREKQASYEYHAPRELEYFVDELRALKSPVIFGGGDLHFTEISKVDKNLLGYGTFELISSCMHSNTKSKYYDNPNPRLQGYLKENFLVLEKSPGKDSMSWRVTCLAAKSTSPFQATLEVG
jgi:alkaline phosphatase D